MLFRSDARRERDYATFLAPGALKGARIGVLRQAYERPGLDSEVVAVFDKAVRDLRAAGATVVDTAIVDSLNALTRGQGGCNPFKYDLERYLAARGEGAPVHTIREVLRSRKFHPSVEARLVSADSVNAAPETTPGCTYREEVVKPRVRAAVNRLMDTLHLDALVYPTWSNPPRLIGDMMTPAGDNSQVFSPTTGFPAITVPMGWTREGRLPAGMTFFGRAWSEGRLLALAADYERATHHRRPPPTTPPLPRTR